jgi:protein phosphatase
MPTFHAATDIGRVCDTNEDSVGWDAERGIWLVADGMGGHARGEVASRLVKETILEEVARSIPLEQSVRDAHRAVVAAVGDSTGHEPMGSTVVAVRIANGAGDVVWVGDSRAYLWHKGRLERLSRDHTFIEELLERKLVTEAQAREHPQRHRVIQTLGMGEPKPGTRHVQLHKGDWVLLCSDGLNDELSDAEIATFLSRTQTPREAADGLLAAALERGGHDNISVVVIETEKTARARTAAWVPIAIGVLGALLLVLLLAWLG